MESLSTELFVCADLQVLCTVSARNKVMQNLQILFLLVWVGDPRYDVNPLWATVLLDLSER